MLSVTFAKLAKSCAAMGVNSNFQRIGLTMGPLKIISSMAGRSYATLALHKDVRIETPEHIRATANVEKNWGT